MSSTQIPTQPMLRHAFEGLTNLSREDPPSPPRAPPPSPKKLLPPISLHDNLEFLELSELSTSLNDFGKWQELNREFADLFLNEQGEQLYATSITPYSPINSNASFEDVHLSNDDVKLLFEECAWDDAEFEKLWSSDSMTHSLPELEDASDILSFKLDINPESPSTPTLLYSPLSLTEQPTSISMPLPSLDLPTSTTTSSPSSSTSCPSSTKRKSHSLDEDTDFMFSEALYPSSSCKKQRTQQSYPFIMDDISSDFAWLETMDGFDPTTTLEGFDFTDLFRFDVPLN